MGAYHFHAGVISRGKGQSFSQHMAYIGREKIRDCRNGVTYNFHHRKDLAFRAIILPDGAPLRLLDPQVLTDELERAERRRDAQLARSFNLALPVELSPEQQKRLLRGFCTDAFVKQGCCVISAIHYGETDQSRMQADLEPVWEISANPHGHLLVPFRLVDEHGFQPTKQQSRTSNNRAYLMELREMWAEYINQAYREAGLDLSVSHKSLADQAKERGRTPTRLPTPYLGPRSFAMEKRGIHTPRGDRYREVTAENRIFKRNRGRDRRREQELKRTQN